MKERNRIILVMIISLITYYLTTYPVEKVGEIIDRISKNNITNSNLYYEISILFLAAFSLYIIFFFKEYLLFVGYYKTQHNFSKILLTKMYRQTSAFFKKIPISSVISIIMNDVNNYIAGFYSYGLLCFVEGILYNGFLTYKIYYKTNLKLTLLIILPFIIQTIVFLYMRKKQTEKYEKMSKSLDETIKTTLENIKGVRVVRAYNMKKLISNKFFNNVEKYSENLFQYIIRYAIIQPFSLLSQTISYIFLFTYGLRLVSNNMMTMGDMVSVSIFIPMLSWPYVALSEFLLKITEFNTAKKRFANIIESKDVVIENGEKKLQDFNEIKFNNFSFEIDNKMILSDINFSIFKNQTVAIVGKTGSGKSMLIKQLLRFYEIEDNKILIDDECIRKYNIKSIRDKIGYVPQDNMLFSKSVKDNILFYNNNTEEFDDAVYISNLDVDIKTFKDGIDTLVGENGVSLSGGQKQRIQIARALIKDPEILILDDSLSAVDANTEKIILSRLREKRKNKTNIIVSHRVSVVKEADLIIVLDKGKIVDKGTHNELISRYGWYKKLNDYQNSIEGDFNE